MARSTGVVLDEIAESFSSLPEGRQKEKETQIQTTERKKERQRQRQGQKETRAGY